jgi:hypothetical protein
MVSILKQVADHNIYVYIYGHIMPFWSLFLALCESKLRWEKKKKDMYKLMRVWKGIETRIDIYWEILHGRSFMAVYFFDAESCVELLLGNVVY